MGLLRRYTFIDVEIPENRAWYEAKAEFLKKSLYVDRQIESYYKELATLPPTLERAGG